MNQKSKRKKLTQRKRYDLPLHRGSGGYLVAWTVGVVGYLAVLLMVTIFGLSAAQNHWQSGLTGTMTLELPYNKARPVTPVIQERVAERLNNLQGVDAHILTIDEMDKLVGPWLGTGAALNELPLPVLIDIKRLQDVGSASVDTIRSEARKIVPDAILDTHEEWLEDLMQLAKACRMILIIISVVLGITAAITVAATSRTRLALHKDEVDLLHLIGATDDYIATQFQRQAFRLAFEGAAGGLVLALVTMGIIAMIKKQLGETLVPQFNLSVMEWMILFITPLLAGIIAMIASRFTVLGALKKIP